MTMRARRRLRGDTGQEMAIELLVLLPVVVALVLLVSWAGRYTTTRARLVDVAAAAARAASLEADETAGRAAASSTVAASSLPDGCADLRHSVAVAGPVGHPGSWRGARVTVTVACTVADAGLVGALAPGERRLEGRASHPVDPFRAA
jgi:Flp pilus assembly protein TadG